MAFLQDPAFIAEFYSVLFKQTASPGENTDLGLSIVKYETTEAALKLDPKIKKCLYDKDLKNLEPSVGSR